MSGSAGKGHAYIVFDYAEALRIYDAVSSAMASTNAGHCTRCRLVRDFYERILLELLEFFNAVDLTTYATAREAAREAHDAALENRPPERSEASE